MGDDDGVRKRLAEEKAALRLENAKLHGQNRVMKRTAKVVALVLAVVTVAVSGAAVGRARAAGHRETYVPTLDELRDMERVRADQQSFNMSIELGKQQLEQRRSVVFARAQARLNREGLGYDYDKSEWFVAASDVAPPASATTATVTTQR